MKVTNIRISQKRSLGNYENIEIMAEAVLEDEESLNDATNKLYNYVDWHAQKTTRDAKAKTNRILVADERTDPAKKAEAEKWLARYEERKAEVEGM